MNTGRASVFSDLTESDLLEELCLLGTGKWALQKKAVDFFLKLVDKSIDRSMRNVQKNSLPCSSFGLEAISDKRIFKKSCACWELGYKSYI